MRASSATKRAKGTSSWVRQSSDGYFSRALAPAPFLVLTAVVAGAVLLLTAAAKEVSNDYLASASCFFVLLGGAAVLDYTGRRRARESPHPLYKPDGLPYERTPIKPLLVLTTLLAVIVYASVNVEPGEWGSPLPYFLGAAFLFLVMPQLLARRFVRQFDRRAAEREKGLSFRR